MTNSSGGGWDAIAGNGPDVFLTVNSGTTANLNSFVSSVYDNVTGQTLTYSSGLPITLASPNSNYTVAVWDEDTASNDFMGGVYFIPNNFKAGFPSSFNLTTASLTIVLNVTWLF